MALVGGTLESHGMIKIHIADSLVLADRQIIMNHHLQKSNRSN